MAKSQVYFTDFRTVLGVSLTDKLQKLIRKAGIGSIDMEGKFVAIKMHFGELGNLAYLRPNYAKAVADVVKEQGGNSIAIYKKGNESKRHVAEQLVREHRVNFACAGDYRKGSVVWKIVESILHQVRSNWDFHLLQQENLSKFRK
jgi:uncharacterized Fe-S center protein